MAPVVQAMGESPMVDETRLHRNRRAARIHG